jgi:glutamine synthetase
MLRAGLEGIRNKIEPPAEYASSVYGMTSEDMEKENIECYPSSLEEALEYMRQDDLVRETLGDHSFWIYYNAKLKEWNEYAREVHDWEFRKYLKKY